MVDAVLMRIEGAEIELSRVSDIHPINEGRGFWGKLGTLRIIQTRVSLSIRGSLPRYLTGTNAGGMTREMVRAALGKIEAEAGVSLARGNVYGMEIGRNLPMLGPPQEYMKAWLEYPTRKRIGHGEPQAVIFANKSRSFTGYDKGAESKADPKPEIFRKYECLRLEERIKCGLKRYFGHDVRPWDLGEPDFYEEAVTAWGRSYFRILKRREVSLMSENAARKEIEKALLNIGLASYGVDRVQAHIEAGRKRGTFDKKTAQRLRAWIREIAQDDSVTDPAPLTEELDKQVSAIVKMRGKL